MKKISVFMASPGDLLSERGKFRETIQQLNIGFGKDAGFVFEPFGWEDALATTGRRNQGVINSGIDRCDIFILAMYRRWGQEAPDAEPYTSYTEEEFHRALERWKKDGKPEIFVFFKRVDAASEADPGPQLKKVMEFRKQLEETRQLLYRHFDDEQSFTEEIDKHLRAFVKGELPGADHQQQTIILPLTALAEVKEARKVAAENAREAEKANDSVARALHRIEEMQLQLAEDAARLSKEGKTEFARHKFSELLAETMDTRILSLAYEFFERTGDLDTASSLLHKWLHLNGPEKKTEDLATAYRTQGNLHQTRGELDLAAEMYYKSLALLEELGGKKGLARIYANLGVLYQIQGDFDQAEEMFLKALAINEELDRKKGMASDYVNLGNIYKIRADLEQAEEMYRKSLAIYEESGHQKGLARTYGNLGILYQTRGDLEQAEEMYQQSFTIYEELSHKEGMASIYGNLGILFQARDDLERAEEMFQKSLAIENALGRKEGMASDYGNLGILYQTRGDFEQAVEMFQKSLALNEALGRKEGIASDYGNLGSLYQSQGNLELAEEMYQESLRFFSEIKSPNVEVITGLLHELRLNQTR